jgi:NAD(P)-dependent dehydrogenase (short-subunit alcohol dehydrogenase family)
MVSLTDVQASNSRIVSTLPPKLVAVFVGATSGIGETTVKQFAKHTTQPRIYLVGRSQEAADRIISECQNLNAEGEYIFVKADLSLLSNVDNVCTKIKMSEKIINLLFLSSGSLAHGFGGLKSIIWISLFLKFWRLMIWTHRYSGRPLLPCHARTLLQSTLHPEPAP